jgi:hypothetical protein
MTRQRLAVLAFSALLLLAAVLFGRPHHPHFRWERVPGVWALIGFAGCWLLVLFAKALAKRVLERDEDYYGD